MSVYLYLLIFSVCFLVDFKLILQGAEPLASGAILELQLDSMPF